MATMHEDYRPRTVGNRIIGLAVAFGVGGTFWAGLTYVLYNL